MAREKLQWFVPEDEFERFEKWVLDKHGMTSPYVGFELEEAMREYLDIDELEEIEALTDRLLDATGRSRGSTREKNSTSFDSSTRKVKHRVNGQLKEEFAQYADSHDMTYGEAVARAMNARRDGGRVRRIRERLEATIPEAEAALATIEDDVGGLEKSERVEISIAQQLGDEFTEDELEAAINDVSSGTEYYHRQYTPRVIERKGVTTHPNVEHLYIPEEKAEDIRVDEIVDRLRDETGDLPVFTSGELERAIADVLGIVPAENPDTVRKYQAHVEDRIGYRGEDGVFAPPGVASPETPDTPNGPTPEANPGGASGEIAADGGRDEAIQAYTGDNAEDADDPDEILDEIEEAEAVR